MHNYQPSIKNCMTKFLSLRQKLTTSDDCKGAWNDAMKELDEYQFEVGQSRYVAKACETQLQEYSKLYQEIEKKIEDTQQSILEKKKQWQQEKVTRRNKEEYEALSRKVNEFSDRKTFQA